MKDGNYFMRNNSPFFLFAITMGALKCSDCNLKYRVNEKWTSTMTVTTIAATFQRHWNIYTIQKTAQQFPKANLCNGNCTVSISLSGTHTHTLAFRHHFRAFICRSFRYRFAIALLHAPQTNLWLFYRKIEKFSLLEFHERSPSILWLTQLCARECPMPGIRSY